MQQHPLRVRPEPPKAVRNRRVRVQLRVSADTQVDEVMRVHSDIAALQPRGPFLLRTPGGSWDATTAATLNSRLKVDYLGPIHWSAGDNVQIGGVNYKADYACWSSNTSRLVRPEPPKAVRKRRA